MHTRGGVMIAYGLTWAGIWQATQQRRQETAKGIMPGN